MRKIAISELVSTHYYRNRLEIWTVEKAVAHIRRGDLYASEFAEELLNYHCYNLRLRKSFSENSISVMLRFRNKNGLLIRQPGMLKLVDCDAVRQEIVCFPLIEKSADSESRDFCDRFSGVNAASSGLKRADIEFLSGIIISQGMGAQEAISVAKNLILEFGCVERIFFASEKELVAVGLSKEERKIIRRVTNGVLRGLRSRLLTSASTQKAPLALLIEWSIAHSSEPYTQILCFNDHNVLLSSDVTTGASMKEDNALNAEILDLVKVRRAKGVLLATNVPAKDLRPSNDGRQQCSLLRNAMKELNITLMDYLIVSGTRRLSLRDQGYFD